MKTTEKESVMIDLEKIKETIANDFTCNFTYSDDKKAVICSIEKSIIYPASGTSYYQGIRAFDGKNEIVVKHVSLWRNGENQYHDNPSRHYFVESFKKAENGYELVLENGMGQIEIISLRFEDEEDKVAILERITKSEYLSRKKEKSPKEKREFAEVRIYETLKKENPRGWSGIDNVFLLDISSKELTSIDRFCEDWSPAFAEPQNKILIIKASEALKGNVFMERVFLVDPSSQKVSDLIADDGKKYHRDYFFNCSIKEKGAVIKFYDYHDGDKRTLKEYYFSFGKLAKKLL